MKKTKEPKVKKPKKQGGRLGKFFLALIMSFLAFIALLVIQTGILTNYETVSVVVAKDAVPKGTDITENNYKELFDIVELDAKLLAEGTVVDIETLKENVTCQDIAKMEVINTNSLIPVEDYAKDIAGEEDVSNLVVSGFSSGSLSNSVCGILRRGDTIDITLIYEDEDTGSVSTEVLENVYVKQAYDSGGVEILAGNPATATMFNFLLTKEDNDLLNEIISNNGIVRISKTNDPQF